MRAPTAADLSELIAPREGPCVSLYMPTHRTRPDNQQGPVRYRDLLDRVEKALRRPRPNGAVKALLTKFRALADDPYFWAHRFDGLAVLGGPDLFAVFDLQRPVAERAVVADAFQVKPLLRVLQSARRFQVLCLTRAKVRLLEGDADGLDEIDLDGVPATVEEALGDEISVQAKTPAQGGKSQKQPHPAPHGGKPGSPAKGDDARLDAERFFAAVARAVWERHSRRAQMPLVLAALPENQAIFRAVCHNPHLAAAGVEVNPDGVPAERLRQEAWRCLEPAYRARLAELADGFRVARSRNQGADHLAEVCEAVLAGRVQTLLIDGDRTVPGKLAALAGAARPRLEGVDGEDLLDDLAEATLRLKGQVVVLPGAEMPCDSGAAAIFRF
jgi:hypothetical protein